MTADAESLPHRPPAPPDRVPSALRRALTFGIRPVRAALLGVAMVAVLAVVLGPLQHVVTRATQALTLVVPVVVTAVLGGRRAAFAVAAAATIAFSLLIPPVGALRILVAQDLVALGVFSVVALAVGEVVARRIELLGAVERQRSALLRSVSHDLRTPLASIRAAASTLAEGGDRYAVIIEEEAERLDRLVANLLSLSRIEAGAFVVSRQSVDVHELVDATVARLARVFTTTKLDVEVPADLPYVLADHNQLDQLLTNLLENAARHTPAGGTVHLAASVDEHGPRRHLVLTVADEGPGIPDDEVAGLFEPFRSGAVPGASGVGLAICKAVVDGHGGTIAVRDRPGGGAVFTVALPLG